MACALAFFTLLLSSPLPAQRGAITLPQNLGELVDESAVIVRGYVVIARVEAHPDLEELPTVVVTLAVDETLKGSAGPTFTFRQFIWDARDRHNTAGYAKGQHLLLLLIKPSPYGLSSPAGLEQGRFRILRDVAGKQVAVNGRGNAALFHGLGPQLKAKGVQLSPRLAGMMAQPPAGPIPLDDLRELIRQIQRGK
jgi:hypothetical protein